MNTPLKNALKSLLQRMLNDAATGIMFEADGDTIRAAISLCDEIQEHKKTIRKLSDEVVKLTAERDELVAVVRSALDEGGDADGLMYAAIVKYEGEKHETQ